MGNPVRYPDGAGEHYGYDARGNLTERTTTAGECYHYSYDCLARITSIENPAGGVAYFTYDALGRVTKAEDEKGNITCYEYTPNGNLAKVTDALHFNIVRLGEAYMNLAEAYLLKQVLSEK